MRSSASRTTKSATRIHPSGGRSRSRPRSLTSLLPSIMLRQVAVSSRSRMSERAAHHQPGELALFTPGSPSQDPSSSFVAHCRSPRERASESWRPPNGLESSVSDTLGWKATAMDHKRRSPCRVKTARTSDQRATRQHSSTRLDSTLCSNLLPARNARAIVRRERRLIRLLGAGSATPLDPLNNARSNENTGTDI